MIQEQVQNYEDPQLMFKRSTRMNNKHCLCLLCLVLMICIVVFLIQSTEGFKDSKDDIPDYCGSAGYAPSPALLKAFKMKLKDATRGYTESECAKIDGATFKNNTCTLVKDGKSINCNDTCKGLNKVQNVPPEECSVDEKLLGITNKEFTYKKDNSSFTVPENSVRLYTKKECDSLDGNHDISFLAKMSDSVRKEFIKEHGKGYGFCMGDNIWYSFTCYAEPPSVADVKNKISGLLS